MARLLICFMPARIGGLLNIQPSGTVMPPFIITLYVSGKIYLASAKWLSVCQVCCSVRWLQGCCTFWQTGILTGLPLLLLLYFSLPQAKYISTRRKQALIQ